MSKRVLAAAAMILTTLGGCVSGMAFRDTNVPISTVQDFDIERYQGLWYEIVRFPVSFEEGCVGVTARYTLQPDGSVEVLNTCREGSLDAEPRTAKARAEVVGPGQLTVDFVPFIPFTDGDYWILDIDDEYRTVVVGTPDGTSGWVLAREPRISTARLQRGKDVLARNGYDLSLLMTTPQREDGQ